MHTPHRTNTEKHKKNPLFVPFFPFCFSVALAVPISGTARRKWAAALPP
jgi:hypothetical protein